MRMIRWLLVATAFAYTASAQAEWRKATSAHFVIYADTSEQRLREQAVELERFDALLRLFHDTKENADAAFNKVTIYVVSGVDLIQRLSGEHNAAGFYVPRVTGSIAFTPRSAGNGDINDLSPRIVLYHEYAHHFLLGSYAVAYPAWFSEGYAEFASTVKQKDGAYWLGAAANHRAYGLLNGRGLTMRQLFDPPARMSDEQRDALYGRGWLLTHYLMFNAPRRDQLGKFFKLFNDDVPVLEAAEKAFGDLKVLGRELDRYLAKNSIPAIRVPPEKLGNPAVEIAPLSPGQAAMINFRIRSTAGVNPKTAGPLYASAAPVAGRFATDPVVQGWLAEMALDAGQFDAAEKAADATIAADPTSSQGLLYKARVVMARAVQSQSHAAKDWNAARGWIIKANRAQNNDPAALALFYQSFLMQDEKPRDSAKQGLYRATMLVPQDNELRFAAARQQILDGDVEGAKLALRPLAANPHAGTDNPAARVLAALDAGKTGEAALAVIATPSPAPATARKTDGNRTHPPIRN